MQEQPFRILQTLLERRGEIVTREELRKEIWGDDVYVDFDRSLNTSVARLREALGDSPTLPALWSVRPDGSDPRRLPVNATAHGGSGLLLPAPGKRGMVAYRQVLTRAPIWRLDLETGEAGPLIESSGKNTTALYSPDGSKILFLSNRGPVGAWVADADGRNASLLVEGGLRHTREESP